MPERRIMDLPGQLHYVTFSTYQRRRFLAPERPRYIVMEVLEACLEKHNALCHGFVIMPNHVHAMLTVDPNSTIASFLQIWKRTSSYRINQFYAQELTKYHDLCPHDCPVWQARFYDSNLDSDEKANQRLEYMHNNPVEAQLRGSALDWAWSSARFYELDQRVGVTIRPGR
jgi:putative transposase